MGHKIYKRLDVSSFLAWKGIVKNKKTTILILFIIGLGFISSVTIGGIIKNVVYNLEQDFIDTSVGNIILEPLEKGSKIEDVRGIIKKIETLPNIEGIAAVQKKSARLIDERGDYIDAEVWIVNPSDFAEASRIDELLEDGEFLNDNSINELYTGCTNIQSCSNAEGVSNIDLDVGKKVNVVFSSGESANLTLQGVYKHGFEQVEHLNLIGEKTAEQIFSDYNKDLADIIIVRLSDRKLTEKMFFEISFLGINAEVYNYNDKLVFYSDIVNSFGVISLISLIIGVIIAAISVYIILYINILHRRVQIGIIKAIGVDSETISLSYLLQALFYGIFGSILGILLTFLMLGYFNLNPISTSIGRVIPDITLNNYVLVSLTIIIASTLTGYFVSRRIIKQNILNSILNLD